MGFKKSVFNLAILGSALFSLTTYGLDESGNMVVNGATVNRGSASWNQAMRDSGLVVLYTFDEMNGPFRDKSPYLNSQGDPEPIDLVVDSPSGGSVPETERTGNSVKINFPTLIHSNGAASKINRECKNSGELTVEMLIENENDGQLPPENPMRRIMTLSNATGTNPNQLSSSNTNFFMSLTYMDEPLYRTKIRTDSGLSSQTFINSDSGLVEIRKKQHIIFTKDARGISRLYISYLDDDGNIVDVLRREFNNREALKSDFDNWDDNAQLGIGNEISYASPSQAVRVDEDGVPCSSCRTLQEQNPWLGEVHMLAVYCQALAPEDILGDRAPGQPKFQAHSVNPSMVVTSNYRKAALLYKRLAGVATSLGNPIIADMASDIGQGNLMGAAARVTETSEFLNITVRDFASRMSNREETVNAPLNDFVATVIGAIRDDQNGQSLLTGNFYYHGDPSKAAVPADPVQHIALSNEHYESLESGGYDLKDVLVRQSPQQLYDGTGMTNNINAGGLLTTRQWMAAHATAGTNRRLVEFAFREFLCVPMEQWADATAPDNFVGRDIDRFPAGDHQKYTTSCRSCHAVMDSLRGAFAYYDFSNGFVKNTFRMPANVTEDIADPSSNNVQVYPSTNVVTKMNHNEHTFPDGHMIADNSFTNNAVFGANAAYFGWNGFESGEGINQFGRMIANAEAYPYCMAKRVFRTTCKREPVSIDKALLQSAAETFKSSNYNFKTLFQTVAVSEECLGEDL